MHAYLHTYIHTYIHVFSFGGEVKPARIQVTNSFRSLGLVYPHPQPPTDSTVSIQDREIPFLNHRGNNKIVHAVRVEPNIKTVLEIYSWLQIYHSQQPKHRNERRQEEQEKQNTTKGNNEHSKREAKQVQPLGSSPPVPFNNRVCFSPNILFPRPGVATVLESQTNHTSHNTPHLSTSPPDHSQRGQCRTSTTSESSITHFRVHHQTKNSKSGQLGAGALHAAIPLHISQLKYDCVVYYTQTDWSQRNQDTVIRTPDTRISRTERENTAQDI